MAHGKETPRQKMIGMMYLVLTALLALNVSAEVLKAFELIDNSLRKTTSNTVIKNDKVYTDFESAMKEKPGKTKPYKEIADQIKIESGKLVSYIDELKLKITKIIDGPKGDPNHLVKMDDINVPGQVMVTEKENGKTRGVNLKEKIEAYREFLIKSITKEKTKQDPKGAIDGFKKMLNTEDVIGMEGNKIPWVNANFDQLPNAGVMALMSKMQADIRNAESDALNFLFAEIEAGTFKFNKLDAVVTSKSSYVLMGQPYKAEVFIAASDTTAKPVIKLNDGTILPVEGSKGIFSGGTGSAGPKTWGGVIEVKSPSTGQILSYKFESEYTVGAAALVVSPTKMNVFYIGVDNPVDVSVPGVPPNKVSPYMTGGQIVRSGNGWVVRVRGPQGTKVTVSATADLDGQKKNMGSKEFRVYKVPDPVAKVGGMRGGRVDKSFLMAQTGVAAVLENFYFDLAYSITGFNVSVVGKGGFVSDARTSGAKFSGAQVQLISQATTGRKVYIEDIQAKGPDGTIRELGTITFTIK